MAGLVGHPGAQSTRGWWLWGWCSPALVCGELVGGGGVGRCVRMSGAAHTGAAASQPASAPLGGVAFVLFPFPKAPPWVRYRTTATSSCPSGATPVAGRFYPGGPSPPSWRSSHAHRHRFPRSLVPDRRRHRRGLCHRDGPRRIRRGRAGRFRVRRRILQRVHLPGPGDASVGGSCVNVSGDAGPPDLDGGMSDGGHHGWDGGHGAEAAAPERHSGSSSRLATHERRREQQQRAAAAADTDGGGSGSSGSSSAACRRRQRAAAAAADPSAQRDVATPCHERRLRRDRRLRARTRLGTTYACAPEGSPANIAACGDCSDLSSSCGEGGVCITLPEGNSICVEMCCTDADCGQGGQCNTSAIQPSLPDGVGVCVLP